MFFWWDFLFHLWSISHSFVTYRYILYKSVQSHCIIYSNVT